MASCLPSNATRDATRKAHERFFTNILELDLDRCQEVYGVSPCTAGITTSGTAQAGSANTITLAAGAPSTDLSPQVVRITAGAGSGQEGIITSYDTGTKVATMQDDWSTNPDVTSVYDVINRPSACYNTFATCQDIPNYNKGTETYSFLMAGSPLPIGQELRPYIDKVKSAPTKIEVENGLARRHSVTVSLFDEADDVDSKQDPYRVNRQVAPAGTFWGRLLARNKHYAGRFARIKRGYLTIPFDSDNFVSELYIIENINGPKSNGAITITLKDPLKLADRNKLPAPTDGKIDTVDGSDGLLAAVYLSGRAQSATASAIILAADASTITDEYKDMSIKIIGGRGTGEELIGTAYNGSTKELTLSSSWSITPDDTSDYEIGQLSITLDSGKISQYADPATTGRNEYAAIESEIIRYTAISGDKLVWTSQDHRAQFGTTKASHALGKNVQYTMSFVDESISSVINRILNESGITDTYIDTALLASEDADFLGSGYNVTTALPSPEKCSNYLKELCQHANAVMFWCTVSQDIKFKIIAPEPPTTTIEEWTDTNALIHKSVEVERLDKLRITRAAMYYSLDDKTSDKKELSNYGLGQININTDVESENAYDDVISSVVMSRWFNSENRNAVRVYTKRRLADFKDPPKKIKLKVDPKDYEVTAADFVDITTEQLIDEAGQPETTRVLITSVVDRGNFIEYEARTTKYIDPYGFIAPNGTVDHPTNTTYAHIANNTELMGDGSEAYLIW